MGWLRYGCLLCLLPWLGLRAEPMQLVDTFASLKPKADGPPAEAGILQQLFNQHRPPLLGVELNRSYGNTLDALLQRHQSLLYTRSTAGENVGSMLPMLQKGFVDLMLEYPKIAARSTTPLRIWPLAEAESFNLVHFACSRSPKGQKIVALIYLRAGKDGMS